MLFFLFFHLFLAFRFYFFSSYFLSAPPLCLHFTLFCAFSPSFSFFLLFSSFHFIFCSTQPPLQPSSPTSYLRSWLVHSPLPDNRPHCVLYFFKFSVKKTKKQKKSQKESFEIISSLSFTRQSTPLCTILL